MKQGLVNLFKKFSSMTKREKERRHCYNLRSRVVPFIHQHDLRLSRKRSRSDAQGSKVHVREDRPVRKAPDYPLSEYREISKATEEMLNARSNWALSHYNDNRGKGESEYMFVDSLICEIGASMAGFRYHINFLAKRVDDPDAPKETFFAELFEAEHEMFQLKGCERLGVNCSESAARGRSVCKFCRCTYHPVNMA